MSTAKNGNCSLKDKSEHFDDLTNTGVKSATIWPRTMENDAIRKAVLQYYFSLSEEGKSSWAGIATAMRKLARFPKNKIRAAIDFLVDERYLKKQKIKGVSDKYRITSKGIAEFSPSIYRSKPFSPLMVSTKGGIFVFGDNIGTIKQETVISFEEITQLIQLINKSNLTDDKKRDFIGDAETVRAQLAKPKPDKTILQLAWDGLQGVSKISEAMQLLQTIGQVLHEFLK